MKLEKILKVCLAKMGEKDFLQNESLTDSEKDTIDRLVDSFNIGYTDAVSDFMPLVVEENVAIIDKQVDCSTLEKQLIYATKLTDRKGVKHRFRLMPSTIVTDFSGEGVLEYCYAPDRVEFGGELLDTRFTAEILADCTLATYYFSLRSFDLASAYYDKFVLAVSKLKNKGREIKIKERRWGA